MPALKTQPVQGCPEMVTPSGGRGFFHSYVCGRPVKQDGLCGIHATAKRKREKSDREWRERIEEDSAIQTHVAAFLEKLGVPGQPHYGMNGRPTGKAVVSLDDLWELVERGEK
jgi:hypothetical protein